MGYSYLENIELEEALEIYIKHLSSMGLTLGTEEIPVKDSHRRITNHPWCGQQSSGDWSARISRFRYYCNGKVV